MKFDIQDYSILASKQKQINIVGRFFVLVSVESNVNLTFVRNNGSVIGRAKGVGAGFGVGPIQDDFHGVYVESADGSAQTVKIAIGDDEAIYHVISGAVSVTSMPTPNGAGAFEAVADVGILAATAKKIITADPTTKEVHLYCDQPLRLGDVTNKPDATHGVYAPAFTNIVIPCDGELWGYASAAGTIKLSKLKG